MVKTGIALIVAAGAAASTTAFVVPNTLPACSAGATTVMRASGGSSGGRLGGGAKFSLLKLFTASPAKRGGGNGGNGGMIGGNNNNNGRSMGEFEEEDGNDAMIALAAMGVLGDLWDSYNKVLGEKPILTKACTSLVGFSVGDTLAQKFVAKGERFDYQRLARMAAFGFMFHGTISHFFYNKLDEVIPGKTPLAIAQKVFTDQVLWAPIFTFVYLTWMGVTSGLSPPEVGEKIKTDLVKGVVGSWSVWPLVHAIGFKFVPLEQRLLYINCIQIGYNVFLSVLGSNKSEPVVSARPAPSAPRRK
ncbi:hypothetical protein JKP88DRAFT_200276 [Tribonema minus]|uniref:Uncharacterized protein n=1 Tax=Tribonema minus TaxID=303371 RepID=A0A836CE62_9STRA|nr:hypothetical protein JKP88DRAFT_200276 [Tribonema minus]